MSNDKIQSEYKHIDDLLRESYYASKRAYDVLFRNLESQKYNEKRDEIVAGICLNEAISLISAAKAIYYSDYEELEHSDIEGVFSLFDRFSEEFLESLSTEHSHQHTQFYYDDYEESVRGLLGISE